MNVTTEQYLEIMKKRKNLMDQMIIDRKTYEKSTQWIREMRKYPDHETFAVGDLGFSQSSIRISFAKSIQKVKQKLDRTSENTSCPR